jgi:hypothetical protein
VSSDDRRFLVGVGGLGALALGVALVPLREVTSAANLAFAFVVLTIAIGELGGPMAATVTALVSALSLDFFLTRPYLRLAIAEKDDVIAFLGLAACGTVAAAFASRRARREADLASSRRHLALLHAAPRTLETFPPSESDLERILADWRAALSLAGLRIRDLRGYVVAASEGAHGRDVPERSSSLPSDGRLPAAGVALPLVVHAKPIGSLDVWTDGGPADPRVRRTVEALASIVGCLLVERPAP